MSEDRTRAAEREWIELALDGNREAFERLLVPHEDLLHKTAALMLGDRAETDDVLQETRACAFTQLARFESRSSFSTWLCGILLNLCRKSLRQRRREESTVLAELDEVPARGGRTSGVLSTILRRELAERLEESITRLPIPLREAFLLHVLHGLDYAQIAQAAGVTESTARVRAFRARALLQAELGDCVDGLKLAPHKGL